MSLFLEGQEVKHVDRRRKAMRRWRLKIERISLIVLGWCGAVGVLFGGYLAVTMLPLFEVREITIHGALTTLKADDLRALVGVEPGTNLFRVSIADIQRRVRTHPWVGEVAVRRKLPHTLWVYVAERIPTALLNLQGLYLVDDVGVIFKSWGPGDPADLPILSGVTKVTVNEDGLGFSPQVASLVRLKEVLDRMPLAETLGCAELIVDRYGQIAIVTERPMLYVRLGGVPDARQLARLHAVLPVIMVEAAHGEHHGRVALVDLRVQRKVIVKYGT